MLGDNSEKSKNPLKKAMRRRNAKAVAFSAPTYIEASDVEYSTDEEADEGGFFIDDEETAATAAAAGDTDDAHEAQDEDIVVEPLRPKPKEAQEPENVQESQESERHSPETQQSNEEFLDAEGKKASHFSSKAIKDLLTLWQMALSADPEMVLCGIRIPSSRTTRPNQRRSP